MKKLTITYYFLFFVCIPLSFSQIPPALNESTKGNAFQTVSHYLSPGVTQQDAGKAIAFTISDPIWKYTSIGKNMGVNSMYSGDLDNDGKNELLCSAVMSPLVNENHAWYTLEYDEATNGYKTEYASMWFADFISRIIVTESEDKKPQLIIVGTSKGDIYIYETASKEIIKHFTLPLDYFNPVRVEDIDYFDINNDGNTEIIISSHDKIYLYNALTYELIMSFSEGANEISAGNIDNDTLSELVLSSGKVLEFTGNTYTTQWNFYSSSSNDGARVLLSDIDADNLPEIVYARSWYLIRVYDADIQNTKYNINAYQNITSITVADVDDTGTVEILYGDGQSGGVNCCKGIDGSLMWQIDSPDQGVGSISVADLDNDGTNEVAWAGGTGVSSEDILYIADVSDHSIEWSSIEIDGPFYTVKAEDIDNDGVVEIVTLSYCSQSGYAGGVMLVFNSLTYELEWQSGINFLTQGNCWNFDIENVDADPQMEIIVGQGLFQGLVCIIDGLDKTIQISKSDFPALADNSIKSVNVGDFNGDGQKEIVIVSPSRYYYLNPEDLSVTYTSEDLYWNEFKINSRIANINASPEYEIVRLIGNLLQVFGFESHETLLSLSGEFASMDVYDINSDGKTEIILGKYDGIIEILDGTTFQVIDQIKVADYSVRAIKVVDLGNLPQPEYIFSAYGPLGIYTDNHQLLLTEGLASSVGDLNGIDTEDKDGDGRQEIFLATPYQILEYGPSLYECLWFKLNKTVENVSCLSSSDGSILIDPEGGNLPYNYNWNIGQNEAFIDNLTVGTYVLTITDNIGCKIIDTTLIKQSVLTANFNTTNETCGTGHNGVAEVIITEGTNPVNFNWNTGQTTNKIENLVKGSYSVNILDSKGCALSNVFIIRKDTLQISYTLKDLSCFEQENGRIDTHLLEGEYPIEYLWNTGSTQSDIRNLAAGEYTLHMTDDRGCISDFTFQINQPDKLIASVIATPDDPQTLIGEGTATAIISGGTPPYFIYWSDPYFQTTSPALNLVAGEYKLYVYDSLYCNITVPFWLGSIHGVSEKDSLNPVTVYPNPIIIGKMMLSFSKPTHDNVDLTIYDQAGKKIIQKLQVTPFDNKIEIDTGSLKPGIYFLILNMKGNIYRKAFEVIGQN